MNNENHVVWINRQDFDTALYDIKQDLDKLWQYKSTIDEYTSTTKVPSSEPRIMAILYNECYKMYEKISNEIYAVETFISSFNQMDIDLENMATELDMDITASAPEEVALIPPSEETIDMQDLYGAIEDYNHINHNDDGNMPT